MTILYIIFSIILTSAPKELSHDFHLSKANLKYSQEDESLQLTLHLFIDDFENALKEKGADSLFILATNENEDADKYIYRYIKDHLQIFADGELIEFEFLGKELSEDLAGVWMYLEAINLNEPKEMKVNNRLLMEIFDDQQNIMNVRVGGKTDYLMFNVNDPSHELSWE